MIRIQAALADRKYFFNHIETENARIVFRPQVEAEKLNLKWDSKCVCRCLNVL